MGCNYLSLPEIPASGNKVQICDAVQWHWQVLHVGLSCCLIRSYVRYSSVSWCVFLLWQIRMWYIDLLLAPNSLSHMCIIIKHQHFTNITLVLSVQSIVNHICIFLNIDVRHGSLNWFVYAEIRTYRLILQGISPVGWVSMRLLR